MFFLANLSSLGQHILKLMKLIRNVNTQTGFQYWISHSFCYKKYNIITWINLFLNIDKFKVQIWFPFPLAGQQAGIIIGCLVGVVAIAAVVSIVVKSKVDKWSSNQNEVTMENVLATPPAVDSQSTGYDLGSTAWMMWLTET